MGRMKMDQFSRGTTKTERNMAIKRKLGLTEQFTRGTRKMTNYMAISKRPVPTENNDQML